MKVYITYDAGKARNELKEELLKRGFLNHWQANNKTYYLPNTSLWHPDFLDVATAKQNFFGVVDAINRKRAYNDKIVVERFIVVPATPWDGIEGQRHAH